MKIANPVQTAVSEKAQSLVEAEVEIFLILDKETGSVVAYCPALELSTYGDPDEDLIALWNEAFQIFIEDTAEKGTLDKLLLDLGWQLRKHPFPQYMLPRISPETFNEIRPFDRVLSQRLAFPLN